MYLKEELRYKKKKNEKILFKKKDCLFEIRIYT